MNKTMGYVFAVAMSGSAFADIPNPDDKLLQLRIKDSAEPVLQVDQPSRLICELMARMYTLKESSTDTKWSCGSQSSAKGLPVEMTTEFARVPVQAHFDTLERCESFQLPSGKTPVLKACAAKDAP